MRYRTCRPPAGTLRRLRAIVCAAAASAVLAATAPAQAQDEAVTITTTPTDSGMQVFYALDRGFFKQAGLDAKVTITALGASIGAAVSGGAVDIGTTATTVVVSAHAHGIPIVTIAPGAEYSSKNPTTEIVVNGSSSIESPADLTGKTVAVLGIRSITQQAVQAWLDANGGNSKAVKYIEMPFSLMPAALKAGRIDAAFISEPVLSRALADGARVIGQPYDAIGSSFLINVWFCTEAFAKAHPDIVQKFVRAVSEASRWANTHHAESAAILEKHSKTKVAANMVRVAYGEDLSAAEIQPVIDISAKYGTIPAAFPAADLLTR